MKTILLPALLFCSMAMASEPVCVSYRVPASRPDLAPYSSFELSSFSRSVSNDQVVVKYRLPLELTGQSVDVIFAGPPGDQDPHELYGENGTMLCKDDACRVVFKGLGIDLKSVDRNLRGLSRSEEEFALRFEVARAFSNDPGGVLTYDPLCSF